MIPRLAAPVARTSATSSSAIVRRSHPSSNSIGQRRWHAQKPTKPRQHSPANNLHPKELSSVAAPVAPPLESSVVPYAHPTAFLIGTFAGALGSLVGMGGGFVMIPLLSSPSLLRLSQHTAHGTSLFAVTTTGIAGALGYGLDEIDLDSAAAIALCGMVTARFGAALTGKLSERSLKTMLGVFMLAVAPLVPAKEHLDAMHSEPESKADEEREESVVRRLVPAGMIGLGSGFLAGLFGVGGGAVVVPALTVSTDMTHYQALGTSLCAMALPAIVGTATHWQRGNVARGGIAPMLAFGSFVGAYTGGRVGLDIPEEKLRWAFSGLMVVLGSRTLLRR